MQYRPLCYRHTLIYLSTNLWHSIPFLIAVLFLTTQLPVSAQSTYQIDLIQQNISRQADRTTVELVFTLKDENQRPAINANILSAEIQPNGGRWQATSARIERLSRPSNIILLVDASGSMAAATTRANVNVMTAVKEAAKSALADTPTNAKFGVYRFSESVQAYSTSSNFSSDLSLVTRDIDSIDIVPDGPTCLYDALSTSIQTLTRVAVEAGRREIIVFTDGRDERRANNQPRNEWPQCSQNTITSVIENAKSNSVSIHTIGLCNQRCNNLDIGALQQLASTTSGFSIVGDQTNLDVTFRQIFGGLNNQWVARVDLCAEVGTMNALLDVKASGLFIRPVAFGFRSDVDCLASQTPPMPVPTVAVAQARPTLRPTRVPVPPDITLLPLKYNTGNYDPDTEVGDFYQLSLSVISPEKIKDIIVLVDSKSGVNVIEQLHRSTSETKEIELPAENFERDDEYEIIIMARDFSDNLLLKPQRGNLGRDPTVIFGTDEFKHEPPVIAILAPVECRLEPPPPLNWSEDKLSLSADISDPSRVDTYEVILTNANNVQADLFRGDYIPEQPIVRAPIPADMWGAKEPTEFTAAIRLTEFDGREVDCEPVELTVNRPGFFQRWRIWIDDNLTTVYTLLGFLASALVVWLILSRMPKAQPTPLAPPPPISNTTVAHAEVKLRLRIVKSATPELENSEKTLIDFPVILGRNAKMEHLKMSGGAPEHFLNISGDSKISQYHLKISEKNGKFMVEDLNSSNKSYFEHHQLEPNRPKSIPERVTIRLGKQTHIELKIS